MIKLLNENYQVKMIVNLPYTFDFNLFGCNKYVFYYCLLI